MFLLQYLVLHLLHLFLWSWASGAAQAAHVVRIILRFAVSYWVCAASGWLMVLASNLQVAS